MPIIDSTSSSKFDALIRTKKAEVLMTFIAASANSKDGAERKKEVAERVKSGYELFKPQGAGSYGEEGKDILTQFDSHYTMGYEMGIWVDSDFHLNEAAKRVSRYEMTVSEYIGNVFLNLFSYFENEDGEEFYHHFLYEILKKINEKSIENKEMELNLIEETFPKIDKFKREQVKLLFNYLIATDFFNEVDKGKFTLSEKWKNKIEELITLCNLEFKDQDPSKVKSLFKDKRAYAEYVTKRKFSDISSEESDNSSIGISESERKESGENIILYGVPGSGKSWMIEQEYCRVESKVERIVFHPDYTYADFVGQILPNVSPEGQVVYQFAPGPFTTILRDAYCEPKKDHILIIEEINRGNAAAIFGEIFQLLDRMNEESDVDGISYKKGTSEYAISNKDIAQIIYKGIVGKSEKDKVRIPSNLTIIGTMNTSDQNVFTLDTAFQRRWTMRMVENNFDSVDPKFSSLEILDTEVTWRKFCEEINNIIVQNNSGFNSSEDKRLGAYFVDGTDLEYTSMDAADATRYDQLCAKEISNRLTPDEELEFSGLQKIKRQNRKFPEKVIKYLWDDAFKFSRDIIFEDHDQKSLEQVIREFLQAEGKERLNIFKESIREILYKK